jgi:hypothetical protein
VRAAYLVWTLLDYRMMKFPANDHQRREPELEQACTDVSAEDASFRLLDLQMDVRWSGAPDGLLAPRPDRAFAVTTGLIGGAASMSIESSAQRRRLTAYHEAGHAVAAAALRLGLSYVTVAECEDSWGHCSHPTPRRVKELGFSYASERWLRRQMVATYAGPVAQLRMMGLRSVDEEGWVELSGATDDLARIVGLAEAISSDEGRQLRAVRAAHERADRVVARHWSAVHAVAAMLLERERVSGREVRCIVKCESGQDT